MKTKSFLNTILMAALLAVLFAAGSARAQQYFSDAGGPRPWDTTTTNWSAVTGGPYDALWASGDAIFEGTGGSVNVSAVNAASLTFNVAGYTLSGGTITLSGTPIITANASATVGSELAGSAGLTTAGSAPLTLTGANTYTGDTTVAFGSTLTIGDSGWLGGGIYAGAITANGTLTNNTLAGQGWSGTISGGGSLVQAGSGTLTLSGPHTYTCGIAVNAGSTLAIQLNNANSTFGGPLSGSGTISTANQGGFPNVILSGSNSGFAGNYVHNLNATLFNDTNSGSANALWTINSGHMQNNVSGSPVIQLGALSGNGGFLDSQVSATPTFEIGALNANTTYGGVIQNLSGTVAINKVGTGTQTLSGNNTYTGPTTISGGVLSLSNNMAALSTATAVTVTSPGVLDLNNTSGSALTFAKTIGGSGGVTKSGSGKVILGASQSYTGATTVSAGTLALGSLTPPTPPVAGYAIWLDASATSTVHTNASGEIYQWDNQGVQGGSFAYGTSANNTKHPTYVAGGAAFNNLPVVNFASASAQVLTNFTGAITNGGARVQVFVVFNRTSGTSGGLFCFRKKSDTADWASDGSFYVADNNATSMLIGRSGGYSFNMANGSTFVFDFNFDGTSLNRYLNSSDLGVTPKAAANFAYSCASIGSRMQTSSGGVPNPTDFWNGRVAEILVYTNLLTIAQRQGIETYLGQKWVNPGYGVVSLHHASGVSVGANATLGGAGLAGAVTVAAGGALQAGISGATLTLSNLTFAGNSTLTVSPTNTYVPLNVTNALTVNGTVTITIANVPALNSTNHILQFVPGLASGSGSFLLPNNRYSAGIRTNGNYLDLVIGPGASYPIWTGAQSTEWSTNTIAGSKNWFLNTGGTTDYLPNDNVVFNDTAGNTTVDVSVANVMPLSAVFNNTNSNYTVQGTMAIAGGTSLLKAGSGSLTLNNANTYTGGTTVSNGTLVLGNDAAMGSGALTLAGGTLDSSVADLVNANNNAQNWNGNFVFAGTQNLDLGTGVVTLGGSRQVTVNTNTLTVRGMIGGGGYGLTKTGNGTLTLGGANTYTGPTAISGGTLAFVRTSGYYEKTGGAGITNGALATFTTSGNAELVINEKLSGPGTFLVDGDGSGSVYQNRVVFKGAGSDNTGSIIVTNSGKLWLEGGSPVGTVSSVNLATTSAQLYLYGAAPVSFGGLTGLGTVDFPNAGGGNPKSLVIGAGDGSSQFDGAIQNSGVSTTLGLVKVGAGTLTLAGANSYTGNTTISNGSLWVISPGSLGATAVAVQSGATLGGNGIIAGPTTVQAGGKLTPGATNFGSGPLTIYGSLTLAAGSTNVFRISKTGGTPAADSVQGLSGYTCHGTLVITDVTTDATPLALNDTFSLLPGGGSGGFDQFVMPALPGGLSWDVSQIAASGYIKVVNIAATPTFSPGPASYLGAQVVTISCLTPGSTIYYTTNGTTPTTNSASGASGLTVNVPADATMTIQAFATAPGYGDSGVAIGNYAAVSQPVWLNPFNASWAGANNWSNNVVADGSGVPANFGTIALFGDAVVTLDSSPTVGHLTFGDVSGAYNWSVDPGTPAGTLTLAGTNPPSIEVSNQTTTISAVVAGTNGLTKTGSGTLVLTGANTYTGPTTISGGTLAFVRTSGYYEKTGGAGITNGTLATFTPSGNAELVINEKLSGPGTFLVDGGGAGTAYQNRVNFKGAGSDNTGSIIVTNSGKLWLEGGSPVGTSSRVNLATTNAQLYLYGAAPVSFGGLTGLGTVDFPNAGGGNAKSLAIGDGNGSSQFDGVIRNSGGLTSLGLVKVGAGTLTLAGANTYTGPTTVSNGTLRVNGSIADGGVTVVAGATLGGSGTIGGATTVAGTLSPGASIGTLTVGTLALNAGATAYMEISRPTSSDQVTATSISLGGTLTVTNVGAALQAGDLFQLFSGSLTGNFSATNLPSPGTGLKWNWNPATGILAVESLVATNPTNITYSVSSGQLTLNWPADHTGWKLQAQTNSRSVGLTATWYDVGGSAATNQMTFPVDATQPTVFYRLTLP